MVVFAGLVRTRETASSNETTTMAKAIANNQAPILPRSFMFTQSETAPIVQKLVRLMVIPRMTEVRKKTNQYGDSDQVIQNIFPLFVSFSMKGLKIIHSELYSRSTFQIYL